MGQGERLENSNSKNLKLSFDKVKFEFCEMKYSWTNKKHSLNSKSAIYIHVIYKFINRYLNFNSPVCCGTILNIIFFVLR